MKYDYLIVGGGLSGLTAARLLKEKGKSVFVLEKREELGGNILSRETDGIHVHLYGPHIFHTSEKRAWDFYNAYAEVYPFVNSPLAFYKGNYYHMPFNMNTFHELWGVNEPEEAKKKIEEEVRKENIKDPSNLEEMALSLVGRTIFETLVKGYTEKQWGRDCKDLPASIIKRLPLRFEYNNNYFNDIYQGLPKGGYEAFVRKLSEGIPHQTGVDFLKDKEKYLQMADKVIYTGRLDEYFGFDLGHLDWRSLRFETKTLDQDSFQPAPVVNYTDREPAYTRVCEHKKFDPYCQNSKTTIITEEYPDSFEEGKIPYYPLNDEKNQTLAKKYLDRANALGNVYFLGRLARYKYLDMDDTIIEAMDLVASL